ncbi:hypothetical protein BDB00DRAFT_177599 [Zychaea mexicana]|uniref:uncharacterized protein n=1 Tax=Zychaea mexicana TaxID=64656 RepID=UPI0022FEF5A4|nr:uncharacterized protein BDB00DRAFT_177599 [Zychaea mexicana]KAI9495930.1 hypothetical protein BDB00DRAFT_177599 [Zychaea mexicana]
MNSSLAITAMLLVVLQAFTGQGPVWICRPVNVGYLKLQQLHRRHIYVDFKYYCRSSAASRRQSLLPTSASSSAPAGPSIPTSSSIPQPLPTPQLQPIRTSTFVPYINSRSRFSSKLHTSFQPHNDHLKFP